VRRGLAEALHTRRHLVLEMAEAARAHAVPLERLSFTGTLDVLRSFCGASAQAPRAALRKLLWTEMLRIMAGASRAGNRPAPGRWGTSMTVAGSP
jgi:hypothetical protein